MSELRLVGLHEDGEHVVLEAADGQRFRLPIDEALRAAVRRDRAQLEQVRAQVTGTLPPREIQARIRAGASAEQVAEESGMPVELIRRYDGPVLAEREHIAAQARSTRIGRDNGAPVLGDLVTDRLATRGVEAGSIGWDAFRVGTAPWTVEVSFEVGGSVRSARWTYDAATRTARAVDDEARWLSETELADEPIPRRHLAAVRNQVFDVEVDAALRPLLAAVDLPPAPSSPVPPDPTDALLDDLSGRRGIRQQLDVGDEDEDDTEFEGFGPQHAFDFEHPEVTVPAPVPGAHPPASRPDLAVDADVLPLRSAARDRRREAAAVDDADALVPAGSGATQPTLDPVVVADDADDVAAVEVTAPRSRARRGRASVPSWDEIVFGAKPE
ncbi:MAG TPA: septation protein SepH [Actinotalea sp.]